jgi:hypothetical protein
MQPGDSAVRAQLDQVVDVLPMARQRLGVSSAEGDVDLEVVDPKIPNAEQEAWLATHLQGFHDSLHRIPIGDYTAYIDVLSFVDYLIINELTRNVDA